MGTANEQTILELEERVRKITTFCAYAQVQIYFMPGV